MRKTSLYLDDADSERLRRVAAWAGRSQSDVIRLALAEYEAAHVSKREFALFSSAPSPGERSVADLSYEELMEGFGT